jgi:hypothetical protein
MTCSLLLEVRWTGVAVQSGRLIEWFKVSSNVSRSPQERSSAAPEPLVKRCENRIPLRALESRVYQAWARPERAQFCGKEDGRKSGSLPALDLLETPLSIKR